MLAYAAAVSLVLSALGLVCEKGSYLPRGANYCLRCAPGKYAERENSRSCKVCRQGFYSSSQGSASCARVSKKNCSSLGWTFNNQNEKVCSSSFGVAKHTFRSSCSGSLAHSEAVWFCETAGGRLCTRTELELHCQCLWTVRTELHSAPPDDKFPESV